MGPTLPASARGCVCSPDRFPSQWTPHRQSETCHPANSQCIEWWQWAQHTWYGPFWGWLRHPTLGAIFQNQPLKSVELQHHRTVPASHNTQSGKLKWPNLSPRMTEKSWSFHLFQNVNMPWRTARSSAQPQHHSCQMPWIALGTPVWKPVSQHSMITMVVG